MSTTKKSAAPKSTPPKSEKAAKLQKAEAERLSAELADTNPYPVPLPEAVASIAAPPAVIVPPPPPLSPLEVLQAENMRLRLRVGRLESEISDMLKHGVVNYTRFHNALHDVT